MYLTGEELRKRRTELGMSLDDLAETAGLSKGYISRYETGKVKSVSEKTMKKLCIAMGYTVASTDDGASAEVKIARLRADMKSGELSVDELLSFAESIVLGPNDRDPRTAGDLNLILAELYREKRRFSDAVRCVVEAEEIFARSGQVFSYCKAVYESGRINYSQGIYRDAVERFKVAERRLGNTQFQNDFKVELFTYIATSASALRDKAMFDEYVGKAKAHTKYATNLPSISYRATEYYLHAISCMNEKAYDDAVQAFQSAHDLYYESKRVRDSLIMKYNIALGHYYLLEYGLAEQVARESYEGMKQISNALDDEVKSALLVAAILRKRSKFEECEAICASIITNESVCVRLRAEAYHCSAESKLTQGDKKEFNRRMKHAIRLLKDMASYSYKAIQIMSRYMDVNHEDFE